MKPRIPRVLVIDDDEAIRKMLCLSLERSGFEASAVAEATEGLTLLAEESFDAVMLDMQMPGMNGHAFLRATEELQARPPVIMMSGQAGIEDAIEGFRGGIADFLTKPFTPREVAALVAKVIERRKTTSARKPAGTTSSVQESMDAPERSRERSLVGTVSQELSAGRVGLPWPPALLEEVMAIGDRTDVDTTYVVRLLEKLPQGAARILQLMKTPTYGTQGSHQITLATAVQRLGIPMAISSALTASLKDSFAVADPGLSEMARKMWENSVVTAGLTRLLALRTGFVRPEAGYLIGLFHNVGELLYLRLCSEKQGDGDTAPPEELAREITEHHTSLGHMVARSWKLDEMICEICLRHHDPAYYANTRALKQGARVAALAVLSNHLAIQINGSYLPSHPTFPEADLCRSMVGIQPRDLKVLVEGGKQTVHDLRSSLAS